MLQVILYSNKHFLKIWSWGALQDKLFVRFCQLNKTKQRYFSYLFIRFITQLRHILRRNPKETMFCKLWVGYRVGSGIDFGCSGSEIPDQTQP